MKYSFISLIISFLVSCAHTKNMSSEKPLPQIKISTTANEVKLGDSKFYLVVPDGFNVIEARGKEGQHGFHILPKDASSKMFGFIEIQHGNPITTDSLTEFGISKEYIQSTFLNVKTKWTVYVTKTGYFDAETPVIRGISASALSNKRHDIDSLISIIETLSEK